MAAIVLRRIKGIEIIWNIGVVFKTERNSQYIMSTPSRGHSKRLFCFSIGPLYGIVYQIVQYAKSCTILWALNIRRSGVILQVCNLTLQLNIVGRNVTPEQKYPHHFKGQEKKPDLGIFIGMSLGALSWNDWIISLSLMYEWCLARAKYGFGIFLRIESLIISNSSIIWIQSTV